MKTNRLWMAALALTGCANDPAPYAQLSLTEQAFAQSIAAGAGESSEMWVSARDKLALAKKNMAEQDYKRARMLAEQAELEARVAELLALKEKDTELLEALSQDVTRIRHKLGARQ